MKKNIRLYGIGSIDERVRACPQSIQRICLREGAAPAGLLDRCRRADIPVEIVPPDTFDRLTGRKNIQGVFAEAERFRYVEYTAVLPEWVTQNRTIVFLDRVTDPHNFGVMVRTMACLGGFACVIGSRQSCPVNETVLHVASGGENYVPVAQVRELPSAVDIARKAGYTVLRADTDAGARNIEDTPIPFPVAVVLGAERSGIDPEIAAVPSLPVSIPMRGAPLSLNVNNACAIFCYEIARQRAKGRI